MKWGRGPSVLAPALLALTAPPALAADQLVKGTRLILKASIARERLSFRSRGPFILPTPGSGDDPTNVGATFQIINPNTSESFTFDLPSTHWSRIVKRPDRHTLFPTHASLVAKQRDAITKLRWTSHEWDRLGMHPQVKHLK